MQVEYEKIAILDQ